MDKEVLEVLKSIDKKLEKLINITEHENTLQTDLMTSYYHIMGQIKDNTNFLKP